MHFYEINICQVMNFKPHIIYNKHEMRKIASTIANSRKIVLPTVLISIFSEFLEYEFLYKLFSNVNYNLQDPVFIS